MTARKRQTSQLVFCLKSIDLHRNLKICELTSFRTRPETVELPLAFRINRYTVFSSCTVFKCCSSPLLRKREVIFCCLCSLVRLLPCFINVLKRTSLTLEPLTLPLRLPLLHSYRWLILYSVHVITASLRVQRGFKLVFRSVEPVVTGCSPWSFLDERSHCPAVFTFCLADLSGAGFLLSCTGQWEWVSETSRFIDSGNTVRLREKTYPCSGLCAFSLGEFWRSVDKVVKKCCRIVGKC